MKTSSYEKVEQITKYITLFFLAMALIFNYARPESQVLGFWICASIAILSQFVAVYNDIRHKRFDKIKKAAIAIGGIALLTISYFLLVA